MSKGKPPPGPCEHCGSAKHWDKECPKTPKTGKPAVYIATERFPEEADAYEQEYRAHLLEQFSSGQSLEQLEALVASYDPFLAGPSSGVDGPDSEPRD